jgi:hypothetical protein
VEQLGAGSWPEGVEARTELALEAVRSQLRTPDGSPSSPMLPDLARLLGRRLKQALYAVSFLQMHQEVFLSMEGLGADMATCHLDLG